MKSFILMIAFGGEPNGIGFQSHAHGNQSDTLSKIRLFIIVRKNMTMPSPSTAHGFALRIGRVWAKPQVGFRRGAIF